jgi:hypothetical protein
MGHAFGSIQWTWEGENRMKRVSPALGLAILALAGCQNGPQAASHANSAKRDIAQILAQKAGAGQSCARVVIDGERIVSVQLHGWRYLGALKKFDTAGCPETFRGAWADYLDAWGRKLVREQANRETLDLISMWKGSLGELPSMLRRLEAYDTESAWQNCERVASQYGVNPAKVTPVPVGGSSD